MAGWPRKRVRPLRPALHSCFFFANSLDCIITASPHLPGGRVKCIDGGRPRVMQLRECAVSRRCLSAPGSDLQTEMRAAAATFDRNLNFRTIVTRRRFYSTCPVSPSLHKSDRISAKQGSHRVRGMEKHQSLNTQFVVFDCGGVSIFIANLSWWQPQKRPGK